MKDTQLLNEELEKLKIESQKKRTYKSIFVSMGILSVGLPCMLYNDKVGAAILVSGLIPLLINPEMFSENRKKIKGLEEEINKKTL